MTALWILILAALSCIAGAEYAKRVFSLRAEVTRKFAHITTSLVAAIAPLYIEKTELIIVALIFAGSLYLGRLRNLFSAIQSVDRKSYGEVMMPLGVALSAALFLPEHLYAYQFAMLIVGLSDAAAEIVGSRFGKHVLHIFGSKKSIEGSLAFLAVSCAVALMFGPLNFTILLALLLLTIIELCFVWGSDNLLVPLAAGVLFQIFF